MRRTEKRWCLCLTLLVLNLAFIWGNSALPGAVSQTISDWVALILGLGSLDPGLPAGSGLLRKAAHFAEFTSLGLLLGWLAGMRGQRGGNLVCSAVLGGLLTACVDESIQLLTPERASSLVDVWLDLSGVVTGIGLLLVGHHLLTKKTKRRI